MLPALCVSKQPLKVLAKGAKILSVPKLHCNNTTRFVVNNAYQGTYQVVTHAGCICNEIRALHNRHLIDRALPEYDKYFIRDCAKLVFQEFSFEILNPCSYWSIINSYVGRKRNTYMRAYEDIQTHGFLKSWAIVNMFVKPDKYPLAAAYDKAPRAIQYRRPAFNLILARYLHPVEKWLYEQLSPTGFRFIAKGLNNVDRAIELKRQSDSFSNPCYILLDHSAFDSSITQDHLKMCHKFYSKLIKSRTLQKLLRCQLVNKGYSRHGIKYKVTGTRMSGDFDTALGNCIVNYVALRSWLKMAKVRGEILLDGDDSIVTVERSNLARLDMGHFSKFGLTTKINVVHEITSVDFCQAIYLPSEPPRFARNPLRALSRYNISIRNYHGEGWFRYLAGIGLGEAAVSVGVPILEAIGHKLAALSTAPIFDTETWYKSNQSGTKVAITDEVRMHYYSAYGIAPEQQIAIESDYTPNLRSSSELLQEFLSLPHDATETTWLQ